MTVRLRLSLFLLSAATLAFEINLTRLFSVAQFYHFAFMVVSLALLGFGASGSLLTIFPRPGRKNPPQALGWLSLAAGISILGAFLLTNGLPFDSFSLTIDPRQAGLLVLHYLALAAPFFFSGMAVSLLLEVFPGVGDRIYAVNLAGSALGCVIALITPNFLGGEGSVVFACSLCALACILSSVGSTGRVPLKAALIAAAAALCLFSLADGIVRLSGSAPFSVLKIHLSPYKSLSYALQYPGAELVYQKWNSVSRVDVVRSPGVHSVPGLSYRFLEELPVQYGLLVDGDDLSGILAPDPDPSFAEYMPAAIAFHLRPENRALILGPRGGLDIFTALSLGVDEVTAVENNPLIVQASSIYTDPRVEVARMSERSYLKQTDESFGVIILSLASSYHPVSSGAYSLAEDYRYTVEAVEEMLSHLTPDGLLVITRWLQDPPSEELRVFALAVTSLEDGGTDPRNRVVAFRGYNTATLLVKNQPFSDAELKAVREFTSDRAFDLVYAPDIQPGETNRYNVLPESIYYESFQGLLEAEPRQDFYSAYPFDVSPPTDDHPFFGHYFKWSQALQVLNELGRTWQPFGGAGYLVILVVLVMAVLLAAMLVFLPVVVRRVLRKSSDRRPAFALRPLLYFMFIGFAFLLVEMPLIQRFILFLDHPAYAMTMTLFSLLFFSALGSRVSHRLPLRYALITLVFLLLLLPFALPRLYDLTLGLPLFYRLLLTLAVLAPLGFLMGVPFPAGIRWLQNHHTVHRPADGQTLAADQAYMIPWVWAANGAASVIAAVLAALLALSFGFTWVLLVGAGFYFAAWITGAAWPSRRK